MFYDNRHSPELQEWCYRMMNDPNQWEKFRYTDAIYDYSMIIEEFQKSYEQTPVTQRYARARILSGMKRAKRYLARTQAEYDEFKQYKARMAITKVQTDICKKLKN
jgi:hypothetical protein